MVEERTRLHQRRDGGTSEAKKEERETTLQLWQRKWENTQEVAQWKKIGKSIDDNCIYCGKRDTVEHTVLDCKRWQAERSQLKSQVGKEMQSVTNMINLMVEHSGIWKEVHRYIRDVMSKKEKETRQRN
ncbi:hypothetical protein QE152_g10290 [Popillia japonica]|uniref:Reverse transcriptase zinc-binding domain-containing protein n=1 Tax=Popillia japonica TaxID=7064 RepID=A0AAW1LVS0_POPJA